jgi:maltooligosyltrehalose trehalohydrolase
MGHVWAPSASSLSLVTNSSTHTMKKGQSGWWRCNYQLEHGEEYAYQLDGQAPIPDPRSPWQPNGVHGKSRHVDHSVFPWTDDNWQPKPLPSAILYELHIGTFTPEGTFDAAIERLDHLVDLGIFHVEVMPIAEFEGDFGWGYDSVALFAPYHRYGGPDGFKRFVDTCHMLDRRCSSNLLR